MHKRLGLLCAVTLAAALGAQAAEYYEVSVRRSPEDRAAIITNDRKQGDTFKVIGLLPGEYSVCVKSEPGQGELSLLAYAAAPADASADGSDANRLQLTPAGSTGRVCAATNVDESGELHGQITESREATD